MARREQDRKLHDLLWRPALAIPQHPSLRNRGVCLRCSQRRKFPHGSSPRFEERHRPRSPHQTTVHLAPTQWGLPRPHRRRQTHHRVSGRFRKEALLGDQINSRGFLRPKVATACRSLPFPEGTWHPPLDTRRVVVFASPSRALRSPP